MIQVLTGYGQFKAYMMNLMENARTHIYEYCSLYPVEDTELNMRSSIAEPLGATYH